MLRRGGTVFSVATPADEPDVRRLLRENIVGGRYGLSLEREPWAFSQPLSLSQHVIIAREAHSGRAIGMCERVVRHAYVDGRVERLPYIGALRIAGSHRNRVVILKGGFEAMRLFCRDDDDLPFALTSITADNEVAMRILTRGLPGFPTYHPLGDYSTFVLRSSRQKPDARVAAAGADDLPKLARFLNEKAATSQFAPCWTAQGLTTLADKGLPRDNILLTRDGARLTASIGVWNQLGAKQAVVRRYPSAVKRCRPLLNLLAPLLGSPAFPPLGQPLNLATLTLLAVENDDPSLLRALLQAALAHCRALGFAGAILGAASASPVSVALRRMFRRAIEYRTSLFLAHWPEGAARVEALKNVALAPEVGFL